MLKCRLCSGNHYTIHCPKKIETEKKYCICGHPMNDGINHHSQPIRIKELKPIVFPFYLYHFRIRENKFKTCHVFLKY